MFQGAKEGKGCRNSNEEAESTNNTTIGETESTYRIFHWGGFPWRYDVSSLPAFEGII